MKKLLALLLLSLMTVSCSNKKGEGLPEPVDYSNIPPRQLTYSAGNYVFSNQLEASPLYPTYYGSVATKFSISPELPNGLHFSTISGRIAGTPEGISASRPYVITAENDKGATSVQIFIGVTAQVPTGLRYVEENYVGVSGISRTSLIPEYYEGVRGGGAITSYSISPSTLPPGLVFSTTTGAIEGAPTGGSFPATVYTVTGTNSGGSVSTTISIAITSSMSNIIAGAKHNCVLMGDQISCWGDNTYGQLGRGNNINSATPAPVLGFVGTVNRIYSGSEYTCAINNTFDVYCWGRNNTGQLGPYITGNKNQATIFAVDDQYEQLSLSKYEYGDVDAKYHSCGVDLFNKNLLCVGEFENFNFLSDGYQVRRNADNSFINNIEQLSSGSNFACYYKSGNGVECFGDNSFGQLGDGGLSGSYSTRAVSTNNFNPLYSLAAGKDFACLHQRTGEVKCWGNNAFSQLGAASYTKAISNTAIQVEGLTGVISEVKSGKDFTCALIETKLFCWGNNNKGQLGRGSIGSFSASPATVKLEDGSELSGVSDFSLGEQHACAIRDNKAYCWGDNSHQQVKNSVVPSYGRAQLTIE